MVSDRTNPREASTRADPQRARTAKERFQSARQTVAEAEQRAEQALLEVTRCRAAVACVTSSRPCAGRLSLGEEDLAQSEAAAEQREDELRELRRAANLAADELRAATGAIMTGEVLLGRG